MTADGAHKAHHKESSTVYRPYIDYRQAQKSFFIYQDIQSVSNAPTSIFKEAVNEALGIMTLQEDAKKLMENNELEMVERWYILNSLYSINRAMMLYGCIFEAENALKRAM